MMKPQELTCLLFNDLEAWERSAIDPILDLLAETQTLKRIFVTEAERRFFKKETSGDFWILSKNWYEALRFLAAEKQRSGTHYVSVFKSSTESRGLHTLILKALRPSLSLHSHLLVHSPLNYRFFNEINHVPESQLTLMPLALPIPSLETAMESETDTIQVGTFCEFSAESNMNYFLGIAHYVIQHEPKVQFRIMGRGPLYAHFARMVSEMGLRANVSVVETMTPADVAALDLFLYTPLRNYHFIPLLMAGAYRVPVLATEVPGIEDYMVDGRNGYIVPINEIRPMGELILRLAGDVVLRQEMGKKFHQQLNELYGNEKILSAYGKLFFSNSVIQSSSAERAA